MLYLTIFVVGAILALYAYNTIRQNKLNPKITQSYNSKEGDFVLNGRKNKFTIKKNNAIEFLVEDGKIVAVKDLRKGEQFVYYTKGGKDGSD